MGVNRFRDDDEGVRPAIQRIDPEGERRQVEGVRRVRAERDAGAWEAAMTRLGRRRRGARRTCCRRSSRRSKAYATVGEISDRLRVAWGVHRELITV